MTPQTQILPRAVSCHRQKIQADGRSFGLAAAWRPAVVFGRARAGQRLAATQVTHARATTYQIVLCSMELMIMSLHTQWYVRRQFCLPYSHNQCRASEKCVYKSLGLPLTTTFSKHEFPKDDFDLFVM